MQQRGAGECSRRGLHSATDGVCREQRAGGWRTVATSVTAMMVSSRDIGPIFSRFSRASLGASGLLFTSGGYSTYRMSGIKISDSTPARPNTSSRTHNPASPALV